MNLSIKHLLGLEGVSRKDILLVLDTARSFRQILERPVKKVPTLRGVTIANLFFEPSTRTRISFELAEKRLSADVVNFSADASSLKKGETLIDTARNIEAMKVDMVVMRHAYPGAAQFLSRYVSSVMVNAGDGAHEHPTQALLDFYTIREHFDRFRDLRVVIVGDIKHSRVARSDIWGLKTLGASVAVCGPSTLLPRYIDTFGGDHFTDVEKALKGANVVNVLRLQLERQTSGYIPSLREYREYFGIKKHHLSLLDKNHIIMHPGPINRGIEITPEVADCEDSVILQQVTNGVAVRMAVLYLLSQNLRTATEE